MIEVYKVLEINLLQVTFHFGLIHANKAIKINNFVNDLLLLIKGAFMCNFEKFISNNNGRYMSIWNCFTASVIYQLQCGHTWGYQMVNVCMFMHTFVIKIFCLNIGKAKMNKTYILKVTAVLVVVTLSVVSINPLKTHT